MQGNICRLTYALRSYVTGKQRRRLPASVPSSVALVALHNQPRQTVSVARWTIACYSAEASQVTDPFGPQSVRGSLEETAAEDAAAHARRLATAAEFQDIQNLKQSESKALSQISRPLTRHAQVLDDSQHAIKASSIPLYAWQVLIKLRMAGHDVFVVGGTVRDLLLQQQPQDVDLVTTASLQQVKRVVDRCIIVGSRHPIAIVPASRRKSIEISSLQTSGAMPNDVAGIADPRGQLLLLHKCSMLEGLVQGGLQPHRLNRPWSAVWQQDMQRRDFTINAIMYDPFSHLLFDYVGGVGDCSKRCLRTCKDPSKSFDEDPARLLRAVRLAARCDVKISRETEAVMKKSALRVKSIGESRMFQEISKMLCHGASLQTFQLLWRLHLLEEVIPPYANYARLHKISRSKPLQEDRGSWPLLLRVLHSMDQQAVVGQPTPMAVVAAVLMAPVIVDAVAAYEADLRNMVSEQSAELSKKTQGRLAHSILSSQEISAVIVQGAVLSWNKRLQTFSKADAPQHVLMDCVIESALEQGRMRFPPGVLTRATASLAQQLLRGFYHNFDRQEEGKASSRQDQHKLIAGMHRKTERRFKKGKHIQQEQQDTSTYSQAMLNNILNQAEQGWHSLLLF